MNSYPKPSGIPQKRTCTYVSLEGGMTPTGATSSQIMSTAKRHLYFNKTKSNTTKQNKIQNQSYAHGPDSSSVLAGSIRLLCLSNESLGCCGLVMCKSIGL